MPKRKARSKTAAAAASSAPRKKQKTAASDGAEELGRLNSGGDWRLWGPYLSERQWGTVREDYSTDGNCWEYFPHSHAPYRAYTSGEDGLMGVCDESATLCVSLALWNERDSMLKERLFGLTGPQGNHAEDVKECYYYLDNTPTHSYMKYLYKYPQRRFPHDELLRQSEDRKRLKETRDVDSDEFELLDTGVFDDNKYWDVEGEFAKQTERDVLFRYTVHNRGADAATIRVLPTVWFRNTWCDSKTATKPVISRVGKSSSVECKFVNLGADRYVFAVEEQVDGNHVELLFTNNETDELKLKSDGDVLQSGNSEPGKKGAFNNHVVHGSEESVTKQTQGTKFSAHYKLRVDGGKSATVRCRLVFRASKAAVVKADLGKEFDDIFERRIEEANSFYDKVIPAGLSDAERSVMRQAYAGMLWTKQIFIYDVDKWHQGQQQSDRQMEVRNSPWRHMRNQDIISMPDKWEFPWYATWDLAFHMIPFIDLDLEFAKKQLLLFLSDRYMHSSGQLPAYEFEFSDTNPPVHAWSVLEVFRASTPRDFRFLKRAFMRLSLNFNWWMNQKRVGNSHLFAGGFLGMDNISCVHRSILPPATDIVQADGTGWMAFFALRMLEAALELATQDADVEDLALRYLREFLRIATDINRDLDDGGLWDPVDEFYHDVLLERRRGGADVRHPLRVVSMVGLVPLFAATRVKAEVLNQFPELKDALATASKETQFVRHDPEDDTYFLRAVHETRLRSIQRHLRDPEELRSEFGVRALSKRLEKNPFVLSLERDGEDGDSLVELHSVSFCPGESNSAMFGGNSNWRGPVWICMNYLLIEALELYHDDESRKFAMDTASNIVSIFLPDADGRRPVHGNHDVYSTSPQWKDLVLFYEYFHGTTGRGCGASHQTGWTGLVTNLIRKVHKHRQTTTK